MGALAPHVVLEGERCVRLYHVDAELFAAAAGAEGGAGVSVERWFVPAARKGQFAREFEVARAVMEGCSKLFAVKGGWRIEKERDDEEEFVVVSGWENVDWHEESPSSKMGANSTLRTLANGFEVRHYKRFL